jgi:Glucose/sorbosone dehydrogenases
MLDATLHAIALADLRELTIALELIADGFTRPLYVTGAGDGSGRLFVVEQPGTIWIVRNGQRLEEPFLDIVAQVGSQANEQGLLSIAFSPDYARDGQFFINYTDREGDTVVARYQVADDPDQADVNSARTILMIEQPAANHNGGLLKFGPDGYLYIGTGDGGRAGDPWNNAQNRGVLLGKLLRIDVMNVADDQLYAIPADNPLIDEPDMRPEIWAWGLRNPWRFAFDRVTDDLYIADVGQNQYEEVHIQPAGSAGGANYGWNIMEGATCYNASECDQTGLEQPVIVYSHALGCSITGVMSIVVSSFRS